MSEEKPKKKKKEFNPRDLSVCEATIEMLQRSEREGIETAFQRAARIRPCPIGADGMCCRHCAMGPCRVQPPKKEETPEMKAKRVGVCGATPSTIAARNFLRAIAAGAAAHSDHGRGVAETFIAMAKGEAKDYSIKDEDKLMAVAGHLDIPTDGKDIKQIALEVGEKALAQWSQQQGEIYMINRAPEKRKEIWRKHGVVPRGIDREIVETMHRTSIGVDQDYKELIKHGSRTSLADGWGGSMLATELQDIMFGTPTPKAATINLGILKEDHVNVVIHGHEPLLSEMIVAASQEPDILEYAKEKGAAGIQLGGICCTANEILMRHGVPVAGNFLQQELAIITGALEAMVVDVQCVMENLVTVAECFHTKIITTNPRAHIRGATHIEFEEHHALDIAKKILKEAVDNFANRDPERVQIPPQTSDMIVGFTHETINYMLGGTFRASYRPLNDNIINGRIRGVAGVVGCNNPRVMHDDYHLKMVKELLKHDVLVVTTGCNALACGKAGLLSPLAAPVYCGPGLAEVCETVGIPPVLHLGSCVDNSRILIACSEMVKEGGLGDDLADLPIAGAAPEWMSEKAIAIGQYFVTSGAYVVFGVTFPTLGSKELTDYLFKGIEEDFGGRWAFIPDPIEAAHSIIAHIDAKRKALGIDVAMERVLVDMADRREV